MKSPSWDERYGGEAYAYGTEPNEFLVAEAARIPPGPVLGLAEGEGRNAVFLAARGHAVTAVDSSARGLVKAERLARSRGLELELAGLDLVVAQEVEREIHEGSLHNGRSATVQLVGVRRR